MVVSVWKDEVGVLRRKNMVPTDILFSLTCKDDIAYIHGGYYGGRHVFSGEEGKRVFLPTGS
jgi:hypothetical protein